MRLLRVWLAGMGMFNGVRGVCEWLCGALEVVGVLQTVGAFKSCW